MDGRMGLQPGTVLEFPGMECRIESFVGRGSNAMVYLGSYPDAQLKGMRHQVLITERAGFTGTGIRTSVIQTRRRTYGSCTV